MLAIFIIQITLYFRFFCCAVQSYRGYSLIRFKTAKLDWIEEIEAADFNLNHFPEPKRTIVDIWSEPNIYRNHVDVLVAPEFLDTFLVLLKMRGINDAQIIMKDIQKDIDREKRDLAQIKLNYRLRRSLNDNSSTAFNLSAYHRYDRIVDYLKMLSNQYPNLAEVFNIARTYEGRKMVAIKIGNNLSFKPAIFIDAGIHAREWIAPAVALYIASKLITKYGRDSDVTRMVDNFDWYIVPVANPDGYEYSMTYDRLWRKTRSKNITVNKWCIGADANRNWGYRWGETGANHSPCSCTYPGSAPFSEVETAGIRDFLIYQVPELKIYISLHSYGQLILAPWGYTNDKPNNHHDQEYAASLAVEAIRNKTGAKYNYGTISELMYLASGTSIDYMQDKGVPYIYAIELRPEDVDHHYGFTIPAQFIAPTGLLIAPNSFNFDILIIIYK
ncbi:unnamed protein product [Thelazia callipaeda]|uniref:Peptidase_M14 domain-containing protein n=1 Tax=Thelazia callipaeda TaxID=103827 RepID=A0A158RCC6_THECL|nr:unnamed protein product [Thelazia callipaeda]